VTLYEALLLLHIVAAIVWVGGAITIDILATRVIRVGGGVVAEFIQQIGWMGKAVFMPASISVLGLGIAMVAVNDAWTIGQLWIVLALVGIGISVITGAAFFGPEAARVSRALQVGGPDDPEVRRRLRRIMLVSRLDLLILLLIVADMVIKPGL
jgi:uncharacterized membrane protein